MSKEKLSNKEYEQLTIKYKKSLKRVEESKIDATKIFVMTKDEILNLAVCEVLETNEKNVYKPETGTLNDLRMGTLEWDLPCQTCKQNILTCPGHYGYIKLEEPVVIPNSFLRNILALTLSLFCPVCGYCSVVDYKKYETLPLLNRLKMIEQNKHHKCSGKLISYKVSSMNNYTIKEVVENESSSNTFKDVEPRTIIERLKLIKQKDLVKLGIDHAINGCVLEYIMVIPPISRPYVLVNGKKEDNNLTIMYKKIIESNNILKKTKSRKELEINNLYTSIKNLYNYIEEEIKGKKGIIRGLSMGKRVDYCGRSVLTSFNELKFGEIVYPEIMRNLHTKPINVVEFNKDKLKNLYKKGEVAYITFGSGKFKGARVLVTSKLIKKYNPQNGDVLEIRAQDGDETLFNRQPTLHKQSIMGYKAKYVKGLECIGLHSSYTSPHNADFDGDEGNKHKIQTIAARVETRHIANVTSNIMNSQSSMPTMGLVYNAVTSAYILTNDKHIEDYIWEDITNKLNKVSEVTKTLDERCEKMNVDPKSGKALFSLLLPENFYYKSGDVVIKNGILISGNITKKQIGPVRNSIIHYLWKVYGKERTIIFFTQAQWLLDYYIKMKGFSIGIDDCRSNDQNKVNDIINTEIDKAEKKIKLAEEKQKNKEIKEVEIQGYLNIITRIGKDISLKTLKEDNPLNIMFKGGAKGSETNIAQIVGCLGQQYIAGKRPGLEMTDGTRTLPYFSPNSKDIEANGFIKESFIEGISPTGMIFHMMASRIGLMDTSLKTADTGYIHHRINKSLEDFVYSYDGSVRNMQGVIFEYGYSDGFNAGELIVNKSDSLGQIASFIDLPSIIEQLNAEEEY
jgi:DNA-directed RNA polymerase II subunit RPB1